MKDLELRKEYKLSEIIDIVRNDNDVQTIGYTCENYCIYTTNSDNEASPELVCYVEVGPDITDDDEEIYPNFIVENSLEFFCSGELFEDVVSSVLVQRENASIEDFVLALNYYLNNDNFLDFE